MSSVNLAELVQIASNIVNFQSDMNVSDDRTEVNNLKKILHGEEEIFKKKRREYVDVLLQSKQKDDVVLSVKRELEDFRKNAHESWQSAADYAIDNILPYLSKESRKNPFVRKMLRIAPLVLVIIGIVFYFGFRSFSIIEINHPLESKIGLVQRAAAIEKFATHSNFMNARARRGGWMKGIIFWPIEPTEAELVGAGEFAGLSLEALRILREDGQACGGPLTEKDKDLSEDEVEFVSQIAEVIRSEDMKWGDEPYLDIASTIKEIYPCEIYTTQ